MPAYSTDELVAAVRRLAYLPDASDFTATDILARADEELVTIIADEVKATREEFWIAFEDTTLVANQSSYQLPRRALGRGVRGVQLGNSDGTFFVIPQIDFVTGWNGRPTSINSYCYSFQGDRIVFPALPPAGYTLRVSYVRRPSKLVAVSEGAAVAKTVNTTELQISTTPTWTSSIGTGLYADIVRGDAPFDPMYVDRLVTQLKVTPSRIVFDATTPIVTTDFVDTTAIGNARVDYICQRDQTVYPPLPIELQPVLEAATAMRVAIAIKDNDAAQTLAGTLEQRKKAAIDIIDQRNEEGSRPIVRWRSPLRQTYGIGRRWR